MYCFTYVNNLNCIANELILWSDISSEHPIFITTVAQLTNKNLPLEMVEELNEINRIFSALKERAEALRERIGRNPYPSPQHSMEIRDLINRFLIHDRHFLEVLTRVRQIGKEDPVWQTLLEHISEEQTFMYETFCNIMQQVMG